MMIEMPLFPLNTVLFPTMPITLHIFEERYKQMMDECITENKPFGVVLIKAGQPEGGPAAEPYQIGCTAHIAQVQPLDDGRMNLVAIGQDRFRIQSLSSHKSYLSGKVELLSMEPASENTIRPLVARLRPMLTQYLDILASAGNVEFEIDKLPEDPTDLAFLAATLLQAPMPTKQALLELNQSDELLLQTYDTCRREIAVLRAMLVTQEPEHSGPFSLN